jgi:AcrR family transcriptional regulator
VLHTFRIVRVTARRFRERGFEGIGVADVMKEAGVTVGGFHKHFESRDELIVEALATAFKDPDEKIRVHLALRNQYRWRGPTMRAFLATFLCIAVTASAVTSDGAYRVTCDGGSIGDLMPGTAARLYVDEGGVQFVKGDLSILKIPPSAITEISYGQDVHRRVDAAIGLAGVSREVGALMRLTKSKKHFVGLTWDHGGKKGGMAFQVDKNEYRGVLAGLEGITGKKAINSDAMAVKN